MADTNHITIKLLLVDDDDDLRQDLSQLFRKLGHHVTAVSSGEDALVKAAQNALPTWPCSICTYRA